MIAQLTGKLAEKSADHIIIDVQGVGYRVMISLQTFYTLPDPSANITLHTFTYVREDQLVLYGFLRREEKELFKKLISVSGIGPKLAIGVLSGLPAEDFVCALQNEDIARLNSIPGVGKKTAERIMIELKDKILKEMAAGTSTISIQTASVNASYDDALSALLNLGYNRAHAQKALAKASSAKNASLETVIKEALKELVRQ